ncbi:MAG: hypothetical protein JW719_13465 [Pirellulales bacterium]|nr:hypothetical protein [Pirellulales bacterium]
MLFALIAGAACFGLGSVQAKPPEAMLVFACRADNDLYATMAAQGVDALRVATPAEAVRRAPEGAGVLVLADGYPSRTTNIPNHVFREAAKKKLRLFVEYPKRLPGLTAETPRRVNLERVVAASDAFGKTLPKGRILAIHDCHFVPTQANQADLVVARVAGLDHAVFGLDDVEVHPILFVHPRGDVLVSTTKLSQFVTARYAPKDGIQAVWQHILKWLQPDANPPVLDWTPTVRPTHAAADKLPADAAHRAIIRGIDWHTRAKMLIDPSWIAKYQEYSENDTIDENKSTGSAPNPEWPVGDGSCGVLEGVVSRIRFDGTQPVSWSLRSDSNGESALAFALRSKLDGDPRSSQIAGNLLDWLYFDSGLYRNEPSKANHGLIWWTPTNGSLYGDNDIKIILSCLGTSAILKTDRWDEPLLRNIVANFRTTGRLGFRHRALRDSELLARGWEHYLNEPYEYLGPHYEAWIWASYLWLYDKTKYEPLLTKTRFAIRRTMEGYPDKWTWTNGIQQERGRMLLPLAWLIRVEDRPEYRAWLQRMAEDIRRCQVPCGAIREEMGSMSRGRFRPPRSNQEYGKHEAPLIQNNGDPIADLLYTCNFTFLGLHEAHAATGEPLYREMADRLADFLIRVQIRSEKHPELDGGWFRAFDYQRWDYWGSNADSGWGAWAIEVGWTQGWIPTVLALRELDLNLWDLSKESTIARHWNQVRRAMLPNEIPIGENAPQE